MKKSAFYILLLSFMSVGACDTGQIECLRASSKVVSELRDLRDFKGIAFNHVGTLKISQGPQYSFIMNGPENVLEATTTAIENDILVIGTEHCFNGEYDFTIEIIAPEYELISLVGIGDIQTSGPINGEILNVELLGVGDVDAEIYADSLYSVIAGTGILDYRGEVDKHQLTCTGQFTLNGYPLSTKKTIIDLSGTGDSQVTASELLRVIISGAGNVYYQENPTIESTITGSGEIIDSN
ncbi:MAG: DUF2807 domain-containing protein [Cytophagales bacterium]|nr:DUF2807 domain-containing protein [Cytophagales bacterium]